MQSYPFVFFERETGKIVSFGAASEYQGEGRHQTAFPGIDVLYAETLNMTDWYVANDSVVPRPEFPVVADKTRFQADGVDSSRLTGFPAPCMITVNDMPIEITDSRLQLTATVPRTFILKAEVWPYKTWELEVEAIA